MPTTQTAAAELVAEDPEVRAAYLSAIKAQNRAWDEHLAYARTFDGLSGEAHYFPRLSPDALMREARAKVESDRAWRASPKGKVFAILHALEALEPTGSVRALVSEIDRACRRDFDGERDRIASKFAQIVSEAAEVGKLAQSALMALSVEAL